MIPQWAPNIHPLIVHFPIGILIAAFIFDVVAFFLSEKYPWLNPTVVTALYVVGTAFTLITYYSGQEAAEVVKVSAAAKEVLRQHSQLGLYTLLFFGFYITVRLALTWDRATIKRGLHAGLIIAAFLGLGLLYVTAEHGGKLVYGYGVGTGQLVPAQNKVETVRPDSSRSSPKE